MDTNAVFKDAPTSVYHKPGFYHTELVSVSWDVPVRYKRLVAVGSGAYGQVW